MDVESAELIEVLTNKMGKRKGGTVNMCKAFEDHYKSGKNDGFRDGIELGIVNLVRICKELSVSYDDVIDQLMKKYDFDKSKAIEVTNKYW